MANKQTKKRPAKRKAKQPAKQTKRVVKTAPLLPAKQVSQNRLHGWRTKLSRRMRYVIGGAVLLIALAVATSLVVFHVNADRDKQIPVARVQSMFTVAGVLSQHPASMLVSTQGLLNVLHPTLSRHQQTFALNACPSVNDTVVKQLQKRSLAVLLTVDNSSGPHQCTLTQIVQAYGRPNASTTITGTLTNPKEVLLFYDDGPELSGPVHPVSPPQAPATIVPVTLATLPATTCASKTILSIVAHEDDDLLFMNPDHIHALQDGFCLRTVYLTAGDAGLSSAYWLGREEGAEAAYDAMLGEGRSLWIERTVSVNAHEYIRMASPRGNSRVTLVFVRLPDGNITGSGFPRTHYESLARLLSGAISTMQAVDGQSSYSKSDLTDLLASLMRYYHPDEIDAQTPIDVNTLHNEHSDHMAAGQVTAAAYSLYTQSVPIKYYTGYPIDQMPVDVSGQDLTDKTTAFNAYAAHDDEICKINCAASPYTQWLERQYTYIPGTPPVSTPSAATPLPTTTPTPDPTSSTAPSSTVPPDPTTTVPPAS